MVASEGLNVQRNYIYVENRELLDIMYFSYVELKEGTSRWSRRSLAIITLRLCLCSSSAGDCLELIGVIRAPSRGREGGKGSKIKVS